MTGTTLLPCAMSCWGGVRFIVTGDCDDVGRRGVVEEEPAEDVAPWQSFVRTSLGYELPIRHLSLDLAEASGRSSVIRTIAVQLGWRPWRHDEPRIRWGAGRAFITWTMALAVPAAGSLPVLAPVTPADGRLLGPMGDAIRTEVALMDCESGMDPRDPHHQAVALHREALRRLAGR